MCGFAKERNFAARHGFQQAQSDIKALKGRQNLAKMLQLTIF